VLEDLGGPELRRWLRASWRGLGRERAEIDALNVFPVPDGDTGTNLQLTVEAVVAQAGPDDASGESAAGPALAALARSALAGARGNSGAILAQYLRGMAVSASGPGAGERLDGPALTEALAAGAGHARVAVGAPVEGTVLSVADAAADAARTACVVGVDDLATVAGAAAAGARAALARTPEQLAVLAEAGVVDAGGRGLVVVLDALVATVVDADVLDAVLDADRGGPREVPPAPVRSTGGTLHADATLHAEAPLRADGGDGCFEVMYALAADDASAASLRSRLVELGDSVVVSGGEGEWTVHVHLVDAGAAVEAGLAAGTVSAVRISRLVGAPLAGDGLRPGSVPAGRAVLVLLPGDGLAALIADAGGAVVAATDGPPTAAELLAHVRAAGAGEVLLMPSGRDALAVCETVARTARHDGGPTRVRVVPTRAVVQSLAALAVHEPARDLDEVVVTMTAAVGATRYGALAHATRAALTTAGRCEAGDVLGLVADDVVTFGRGLDAVADDLVARLLASGGELVTLVGGAGAPPGFASELAARVRVANPAVEVVAYEGGQPGHPLLVGVE